MANQNLNDYSINWTTQLVTVDEMNIQLNQLINNVAYLTDPFGYCILYGGNVLKASSTSISVSLGVFRVPDKATTWPAPYTTTTVYFKCPTLTISSLSTNGTYYLVARLSTNSTDPNFLIYTGAFQVVSSVTAATDVQLAKIIIAGNVITEITYLDNRANDFQTMLEGTLRYPIAVDTTLNFNQINADIFSIGSPITITLPNLIPVYGGLYRDTVYNIANYSTQMVYIVPNPTMTSSKILNYYTSSVPFILTPGSIIATIYDQHSNSWYFK